MSPAPVEKDIRAVFAGLRPLAAPEDSGHKTKEISRGHRVLVSPHQMITIIGGKWTTYRRMAEDAVDQAIGLGRLNKKDCQTASLPIWVSEIDRKYGLKKIEIDGIGTNNSLLPGYPWTTEDVRYMIREEYAMTIEDVVSRRMRLLVLDAECALRISAVIGDILEQELDETEYDKEKDLLAFMQLAKNYMWKSSDF